ncbi:sugar-specific transcriptional regulator TrmB/DNA-binding CsgD family transcriptional regulator [Hamadaea flava]|uniref:Helix-turn-helix domain-containing protein n=1 Tax=Hamadaea flava TaxID=1742688 RepID=A0ABV8LM34_9ACTN|nr:helix-turn-helix domain-containing protein [Hamadaea flava]MCP2323844.1 sugar-specific transcriptional regulator TrmB/DNA-binding CsgD family transcriptional regulator [Hamadaea flava]
MLEALGVLEEDEALYRVLLRERGLTPAELTERAGRGARAVRQSLHRLAECGLVSRLAGRPIRYVAARPDTAVEALIARRQQELAATRQAAELLLADLPADRRHRPEEELEIVFGREAVATRFQQLQQSTRRELLVLDRPPYAQNPSEPNPGENDLLSRGVRLRGIYAPEALELPGALRLIRAAVEAGEEARVCDDVPLKLAISDRSAAILPFTADRDAMVDSALVVYASTLLDALIRLFDLLWNVAVPVFDSDSTDSSTPEGELLMLLAAGLKDEAVARQLGISVRTVHRRTSELMDRLGARTRFQAGLAAARQGLI